MLDLDLLHLNGGAGQAHSPETPGDKGDDDNKGRRGK